MKTLLVADVPPERDDARWAYEIKWDGVRSLAFHDGAAFKLLSRNQLDATFRYPEIVELGRALGRRTAIFDGEIVALDAHGEPSFPLLQKRMNVTRQASVDKAAKEVPAVYMLFDVLYLDGRDLRRRPWHERRALLEALKPVLPPACRVPPVQLGAKNRNHGGLDMLEVAREQGLEGIVGKRVDAAYEEGQRSGAWVKIKLVQRQELVVGGWVPEVSLDGTVKPDEVGALILGFYEPGAGKKRGAKLHLAGAVGTGFTAQTSREMVARLKPLATAASPFHEDAAIRKFRAPVQFVTPKVVIEAEYRRWPAGGLMQQAAFKGVRQDKPARDVVRELPADGGP
jgi:bifunctional non-homologous end joining protein LigD